MAKDFAKAAACLNQALDAIEARLAGLEPGDDLDVVVAGLRDAVRAFDAALGENVAP